MNAISGTSNNMKGNNSLLPKAINSFVTNTMNSVSNSMNAVANATPNMNSLVKNIATPVTNSYNAVPTDGSSGLLLITILLMLVIIGLAIYFSKQIGEALKDMYATIRKWLGYTEVEITDIAKTAGQHLEDAASGVGSAINPTDAVNKFVPGKKQVFSVNENRYTYSDAEPLCRALGAELATYEQVKEAWAQGADWCNYGWIQGQGAVYPTQQSTWEKLQKGTDDQRLQCGMPGVNGGYFDNPDLRFGVACYGEKPSQTDNDIKNLLEGNDKTMTPEALEVKKKELKFRAERSNIGILPFREGAWSE